MAKSKKYICFKMWSKKTPELTERCEAHLFLFEEVDVKLTSKKTPELTEKCEAYLFLFEEVDVELTSIKDSTLIFEGDDGKENKLVMAVSGEVIGSGLDLFSKDDPRVDPQDIIGWTERATIMFKGNTFEVDFSLMRILRKDMCGCRPEWSGCACGNCDFIKKV